MERSGRPVRWWPLFVIMGLTVLGLLATWILDLGQRQNRVALIVLIGILATLLGLIWLLFLSRLRWRVKFGMLAIFGVCVAIFVYLFPFQGFSGDLIPLFAWRFQESEHVSGDASVLAARVSDSAQFLGPNRNGVLTEVRLQTDLDAHPPRLIWRRPVGAGWSSFAVVGDSAVTQEQEETWEKVVCYALETGEMKWEYRYEARYDTPPAGVGPRATPTISGDRVYTVGSTGVLNCLDFETGEGIWTVDLFTAHDSTPPVWGYSVSPLVYGDLVIVSAGGAVAYHKESGEVAWIGKRTLSGYSSPMLATFDGVEQLVLFNHGLVTAHDPLTGTLFWEQSWPSESTQCVAQPLPVGDDRVIVSTSYGVGTKLFQVSRNSTGEFDVSTIWETKRLKAKFTSIIHHEGHLYALDDGIFACVRVSDGARRWKRGRYGHGQTLFVSGVLLVLSEPGDLVLLEPNSETHKEYSRFPVLEGRAWNTPALAGDYLLVRNDREAACYQLATVD